MNAFPQCLLLFALNWLDAQLTVIWVRSDLATEGNGIMAMFLEMGDAPFLAVKLLVGSFAAYVLYRSYHLAMARHGLKLVIGLYSFLMLIHAATGLSALGFDTPVEALTVLERLPKAVLALIA